MPLLPNANPNSSPHHDYFRARHPLVSNCMHWRTTVGSGRKREGGVGWGGGGGRLPVQQSARLQVSEEHVELGFFGVRPGRQAYWLHVGLPGGHGLGVAPKKKNKEREYTITTQRQTTH